MRQFFLDNWLWMLMLVVVLLVLWLGISASRSPTPIRRLARALIWGPFGLLVGDHLAEHRGLTRREKIALAVLGILMALVLGFALSGYPGT
jgi:hypothetical protein